MIAIVDYDAGNLKSVEKALQFLDREVIVTRDPKTIEQAEKVILPGVGSFGNAMNNLEHYNLVDTLKKVAINGTPFLGICLGLQLLFDSSEESEGAEGLSILKGRIKKIPPAPGIKIPHMGWNSLQINPEAVLFKGLPQHPYVYFVHSFYLEAAIRDEVAATAFYGATSIDASVESKNIFACQFHPEKSGDIGLGILRNFAEI